MDLTRLRNLLALQIPALKDSATFLQLPSLCVKLGLPRPTETPGMSKRQYLEAAVDAVEDAVLPEVAARLLAHRPLDARTRNNIEDLLWSSDRMDVPRRIRRELARGLEMEDLYRRSNAFEALLDRFWNLDDDELEFFVLNSENSRSLRKKIERHVFRNPDWTVEELFDALGAFNAPSPRFVRFIEALTTSELHEDEPAQRNFVARANPYLRNCNVELRETGTADGYPVFAIAAMTDKPLAAPKQLIFASPVKPDIRFLSALDNDIEIVKHADRVLVYDRPIGNDGLPWSALQAWWQHREQVASVEEAKKSLYRRLQQGLPRNSPPQQRLFKSYFQAFKNEIPDLPALLPEVWLHWDPKTVRERGADALTRFRMDFLMLLPRGIRVVIEVDGKHHYASVGGQADGERYATMAAADRDLKLAGYEVFRFGAEELQSEDHSHVKDFFDRLFDRFKVRSPS